MHKSNTRLGPVLHVSSPCHHDKDVFAAAVTTTTTNTVGWAQERFHVVSIEAWEGVCRRDEIG